MAGGFKGLLPVRRAEPVALFLPAVFDGTQRELKSE
jgi:hypothetical protein